MMWLANLKSGRGVMFSLGRRVYGNSYMHEAQTCATYFLLCDTIASP